MPRKVNLQVIKDICDCEKDYCLLREIVANTMNDRTLEQMKCIEKFKYERSKQQERDIGWQEAHKLWIDEDFAQRFAEVYSEGSNNGELYSRIMER